MMIVKMDNKSKDFYNVMGRFFGSRIVQNKTNDRIYDDNNKEWYINFDVNNSPVAFVSIASEVMKNVYSIKDEFLVELLTYVNKERKIKDSIVTSTYYDVYNSCGFICKREDGYKHFVKIRSDINE